MKNEYHCICHINEIPEQGCRELTFDKNHFFAIKNKQGIYVYYNSCPHLGLPLQQEQDQFLNDDESLILCSAHGALFEIESGLCITGPCQNQSLTMADFRIDNEHIYIRNK